MEIDRRFSGLNGANPCVAGAKKYRALAAAAASVESAGAILRCEAMSPRAQSGLNALRFDEISRATLADLAWKALYWRNGNSAPVTGSVHRLSGSAGWQRLQQSFERVACVRLAFGGD